MKVWQISTFGIDQLALAERPQPRPGRGEILMKVHAVSLNYRDLLMVSGRYNPKLAFPRIPCSDGAGEVVAVGDDVKTVAVGQRVAGIFMQNWLDGAPTAETTRGALGGDIDGMLAEYVVLHEQGVVPIPEHLSYSEGATLPCAGVTAWNALEHAAHVRPGDVVVIQGTGGVSVFALQFARIAGATVIGISSSNEKLERAKSLGLQAGLNYRNSPEWAKWVQQQTGNRGADLIVEVGGAGTFAQSLQAVRIGGAVAQIGVLSHSDQPLPIPLILHRQVRIHGIYVGSRAHFEAMNRAISAERMVPVVDKTFAFNEAREALKTMEQSSHFGKIVIQVVA
ncbi:MAG TPA: NAD(P)-dependent alcohol dehydrogenase [Acidobacteriaceae bacterium]|nr:NAD(P)-dependent alcohol dehydrogenase [Acidobacteriaceae bacterium]